MQYTAENSFVAGQILGNADRLGGWENAERITAAIEEGNISGLQDAAQGLPQQSVELIERVVTVNAKYK